MAAESKTSSEKSLNKDKWMDTTKIEKAAVKNQQQKSMDEDVKSKGVINKLKNLFKF